MSRAVLGAAMPTNSTELMVELAAQTGPLTLAAHNPTRARAVDATGAIEPRWNTNFMVTSAMIAISKERRHGPTVGAPASFVVGRFSQT